MLISVFAVVSLLAGMAYGYFLLWPYTDLWPEQVRRAISIGSIVAATAAVVVWSHTLTNAATATAEDWKYVGLGFLMILDGSGLSLAVGLRHTN